MKKILWVIVLLAGRLLAAGADLDPSHATSSDLYKSEILKSSKIHSYHGIHYVVVARPQKNPLISGSYLIDDATDGSQNKVKVIPIFALGEPLSSAERLSIDSFNVAIRLAKIVKISKIEKSKDGEREDEGSSSLVRFDLFDQAGVHWISQWFNERGFNEKYATFDQQGNVRNLDFFRDLSFDGKIDDEMKKTRKMKFFRYADLSAEIMRNPSTGGVLDLKKIEDIQILAKRLVQESISGEDKKILGRIRNFDKVQIE